MNQFAELLSPYFSRELPQCRVKLQLKVVMSNWTFNHPIGKFTPASDPFELTFNIAIFQFDHQVRSIRKVAA